MRIGIILTLVALPALAQEIKWPANFEKLAAKAAEATDINLDGALLHMAAKALLAGIKSIQVKSFEFKNEGEYSQADLDAMRSQLRAPGWSKALSVIEKRESTEIFIKQENNRAAGIVILAAEPKELTVVYISGSVDLSQLSELGGRFGIPDIDLGPVKPKGKD